MERLSNGKYIEISRTASGGFIMEQQWENDSEMISKNPGTRNKNGNKLSSHH